MSVGKALSVCVGPNVRVGKAPAVALAGTLVAVLVRVAAGCAGLLVITGALVAGALVMAVVAIDVGVPGAGVAVTTMTTTVAGALLHAAKINRATRSRLDLRINIFTSRRLWQSF